MQALLWQPLLFCLGVHMQLTFALNTPVGTISNTVEILPESDIGAGLLTFSCLENLNSSECSIEENDGDSHDNDEESHNPAPAIEKESQNYSTENQRPADSPISLAVNVNTTHHQYFEISYSLLQTFHEYLTSFSPTPENALVRLIPVSLAIIQAQGYSLRNILLTGASSGIKVLSFKLKLENGRILILTLYLQSESVLLQIRDEGFVLNSIYFKSTPSSTPSLLYRDASPPEAEEGALAKFVKTLIPISMSIVSIQLKPEN